MDVIEIAFRATMDHLGIQAGAQQIISSLTGMGGQTSALTSAFGALGTAGTVAVAGVAIGVAAATAAMAKAVQEAAAWESALIRVAKTTGIEKDSQAYRNLSDELQATRMKTGMTRDAAAGAAEAAGSIGIGQELADKASKLKAVGDVQGETEAMKEYASAIAEATDVGQQMAGAFGMGTESAMTAMGQLGATTKSSSESWADYMRHMGSAVDEMGNKLATSEERILNGMMHASSAFALFKPTDDVLYKWTALMGVMQSSGFTNAGEGIKDLMGYMMRPELQAGMAKALSITPEALESQLKQDAPEVIAKFAEVYGKMTSTEKAQFDKMSGDTGRKVWQYLQSADVRKQYDSAKEAAIKAGTEGTGLEASYGKTLSALDAQTARTGQIMQVTWEKIGTTSLGPLTESVGELNDALMTAQPAMVAAGEALMGIVSEGAKMAAMGISAVTEGLPEIMDNADKLWAVLGLKDRAINQETNFGTGPGQKTYDAAQMLDKTLTDAQTMAVLDQQGIAYADYMEMVMKGTLPPALVSALNEAAKAGMEAAEDGGMNAGEAWAAGFADRSKEYRKTMSKEFADMKAAFENGYNGNGIGINGLVAGSNEDIMARINQMQDQAKSELKTIGGSKYNWNLNSEVALSMSLTNKGGNQSIMKVVIGNKEYSETVHAYSSKEMAETLGKLRDKASAELGYDIMEDLSYGESKLLSGEWTANQYTQWMTLNPGGLQFEIDKAESATNLNAELNSAVSSILESGAVDEGGLAELKASIRSLGKLEFDTSTLKSQLAEVDALMTSNAIMLEQQRKLTDAKEKAELQKKIDENTVAIEDYIKNIQKISAKYATLNFVFDKDKVIASLKDSLIDTLKAISEAGGINIEDINSITVTLDALTEQGYDTSALQEHLDNIKSLLTANAIIYEQIQVETDANMKATLQKNLDENLSLIDENQQAMLEHEQGGMDARISNLEKYSAYMKETLGEMFAEAEKSASENGFVSGEWIEEMIAKVEEMRSELLPVFGKIGVDTMIELLNGLLEGTASMDKVKAKLLSMGIEFSTALKQGFTTGLGTDVSTQEASARALLGDPTFWKQSIEEQDALLSKYVIDKQKWFNTLLKQTIASNTAEVEAGRAIYTKDWDMIEEVFNKRSDLMTTKEKMWTEAMIRLIDNAGGVAKVSADQWLAYFKGMEEVEDKTTKATKAASVGYDNLKKTIEDCEDCVMSEFGKWQEAQTDLFSGSYLGQGGDAYLAWKEDSIAAIRETQEAMKQVGGAVLGKDYTGSEYDWADKNKIKVTADTTDVDSKITETKSMLDEVQKIADPMKITANAQPFFDQLQAVYDSIQPIVIDVYYNEVNSPSGGYDPSVGYNGQYDYNLPPVSTISADDIFGSYATGTEFVPETGLYKLHKGEAVTPANENGKGKGSVSLSWNPTYQINGQNSITMTDLETFDKKSRAAFKKEIISEVLA